MAADNKKSNNALAMTLLKGRTFNCSDHPDDFLQHYSKLTSLQ